MTQLLFHIYLKRYIYARFRRTLHLFIHLYSSAHIPNNISFESKKIIFFDATHFIQIIRCLCISVIYIYIVFSINILRSESFIAAPSLNTILFAKKIYKLSKLSKKKLRSFKMIKNIASKTKIHLKNYQKYQNLIYSIYFKIKRKYYKYNN